MAQKTVATTTCDRCGTSVTHDPKEQPEGWKGTFVFELAQQRDGKKKNGGGRSAYELCPPCSDALETFLRELVK